MGAPVSTTHSIVGGVLGPASRPAARASPTGDHGPDRRELGDLTGTGGAIAAAFLYLIKRTITYQENMKAAAQGWCRCWSR